MTSPLPAPLLPQGAGREAMFDQEAQAMKTPQAYIERLRKRYLVVRQLGRSMAVPVEESIIRP